jgi:GNAT superfamily N-acetyltransferase
MILHHGIDIPLFTRFCSFSAIHGVKLAYYILKNYQGKGIGYQLFQACVAWAKSKGADSLDLMVWNFNKDAIAFYERQGMESLNRTMSLTLK